MHRGLRAGTAVLFAFCGGCVLGGSVLAAAPCPARAGYRVVTIAGIKTGVWYPSSDAPSSYPYAKDLSGFVARNGAVADCDRAPLIVFSHGFGGCGTQSVFLTEELARHGYIVAASDHSDALCHVDGDGSFRWVQEEASFFDPKNWTSQTYSRRRRDVELVIDGMLSGPVFAPHLAGNRIGLAGHSLGAYIALGIAGAWPEWKDSRIRAVLAMSPYVLPFLDHLDAVKTPVMYQGAQFDLGITPFLGGSKGAFARTGGPRYLVELRGGSHFEWTNLLCAGQGTVARCLQSKPNARLIDDYAIAFFNRYLTGIREPLLDNRAPGLATYQHNP